MSEKLTIPEGDKIEDFARKHNKREAWVRKYIHAGKIPATLVEPPLTPVPYYVIPFGTKPPVIRMGRPADSSGKCSVCRKAGHHAVRRKANGPLVCPETNVTRAKLEKLGRNAAAAKG